MKKRIALLLAMLTALTLIIGCSCTKEPAIKVQTPTEAPKQETVLPGVWTVSDVTENGVALPSQLLRDYGFDLTVTLYADGTGTVIVNGFEQLGTQKITYTDSSAIYRGKEYAFVLHDGAVIVDYPYNNAVYSIRLTRQGDAPEPEPEPTAEPTPAPTPEPTAVPEPTVVPAADPEALVGTWKVTDVTVDGHVLSENEMRYYRFDLVVELLDDCTGTVISVSDRNFSEKITFDGVSVNYNGVEIPYVFDGEAITFEYPLSDILFAVKLERVPADPAELIGEWQTAKVAAGKYVLSESEIKSYGFDLLVTLNADCTGTVTSPSSPDFREEIVFNGSTVTYQDVEIPFRYEDGAITLHYSMNGVDFTVTLKRAPEPSEDEPVDTNVSLNTAYAGMKNLKSMHMDLLMDIRIQISIPLVNINETVVAEYDLKSDVQMDPYIAKIEGVTETMGKKTDLILYMETVDGAAVSYASTDGGKTWQQSTQDISMSSGMTDPVALLDAWKQYAKDVHTVGSETVNGYETTVYEGTLSSEILSSIGSNLLGSIGVSPDMLKDLDDLPFTVKVANETGYIVSCRIDMNALVKSLAEHVMKTKFGPYTDFITVGCEVETACITVDMSQFNEVPEIVIPDEVRGQKPAEPIESEDPEIVGVWTLHAGTDDQTQQYVDMLLSLGVTIKLSFNADGTGAVSIAVAGQSKDERFTYKLENGQLTINDEDAPFTLDGDLLTFRVKGLELVFKKQ